MIVIVRRSVCAPIRTAVAARAPGVLHEVF
jgi:hypothetical protein